MTKTKFDTNVVKPQTSFTLNEIVNKYIELEDETNLDNTLKSANDFMTNNNGVGLTEEEKDELYAKAQLLYKDFLNLVKENKYHFYLNRKQYKFLTDLLLTKLEYDVDNIFIGIELTSLLASMKDAKFKDDTQLISFPVTATEMTFIYHLISKHKIKGLTNDTYTFSQVLVRIGELSKLINYYDASVKQLNTDIQTWAVSLGGPEETTEQTTEVAE
jgi:hypothetical protein